jgi:methylphosphotriester-DNA--protein-cysteine methyltransferase
LQELLDGDFNNIIPLFEKFLTSQLSHVPESSSRITYAVHYLQQADKMPEISALPAMLNMSVRTFELQFLQQVGFSAKKYAEIVRFNRVLWNLFAGKKPVLTNLALDHHYYDQSHFIHNFHKITQLTPSEFLSRHKGGFFFE